jgi:hypothetical protein
MVDRETLGKAEEVLTRYLALGAPLGYEDEIRHFLSSRRSATVDGWRTEHGRARPEGSLSR